MFQSFQVLENKIIVGL